MNDCRSDSASHERCALPEAAQSRQVCSRAWSRRVTSQGAEDGWVRVSFERNGDLQARPNIINILGK